MLLYVKTSFCMRKNKCKQTGFTLIELLIVIAIMGILAVAGIAAYRSSLAKSRDSKRKSDLRQISLALEAYFNDHNEYPQGNSDGEIMGCGARDSKSACTWGGTFQETNGALYMTQLPTDLRGGQRYFYADDPGVPGSPNGYYLYARLEDIKDTSQGVNQGGYPTVCVPAASGVDSYCTYGISSSNRSLEVP